jgi:FAD/FMN-containing dehydrogenase
MRGIFHAAMRPVIADIDKYAALRHRRGTMCGVPAEQLLRNLRDSLGDAHVLTDPDLRASYETDWTRRWHGEAAAVVRPADTEQVAAVVHACIGHGAAVIPQGGNTGLVGGSVPRPPSAREQVVISLSPERGRRWEPSRRTPGLPATPSASTWGRVTAPRSAA